MARFTADFIPLSGNDLFNMSGEMPPSLRVIMNVPEDIDAGMFKFDAGQGSATAKERFENQDKLKNLLIERYRNLAQVRLAAIRRNKNLGIISIYRQQVELDQGVVMDYESLWGRECVTLIFSEELVRHLVLEAENGGFMLVLYKTNEIAVVEITKKGEFNTKLKRKLKKSSWKKPPAWDTWYTVNKPSFFLNTVQMKISKDFHVLSLPIKIKDGVISLPDTLEQRPVYNVLDTIHKFAEASTPLTTVVTGNIGWTPPAEFGPTGCLVINGSDKTVYNEYGDKFQWTAKTGVVRVSTKVNTFPFFVQPGSPFAYGNWKMVGTNYFMNCVETDGARWGPVWFSSQSPSDINYFAASPWTDAQLASYLDFISQPRPPGGGMIPSWLIRFGPDDSGVDGAAIWVSFLYENTSSGSTISKMGVFSQSKGIDKVTPTSFAVTSVVSWVGGNEFVSHVNYNGIKIDMHSAIIEPSTGMQTFPFPYALGSEPSKMFYRTETWTDSDHWKNTYHTPYETWDSPQFASFVNPDDPDPFGLYYDAYFTGWLQVSNGKHLIQGYLKEGKKRLFLDKVEAGTKLAKAIDCDLEDIVTVILSVKLSDIEKLK